MAGIGGAIAFRDWHRLWTERLNRLDAYLRKQTQPPAQDNDEGPRPDDHWHRRN